EDALMLFGFKNYDQLQLFELLISISGVGPKTALGVFAVAEPADIKSAIVNEDASVLKKVSGIGAKTAERIVLELKNKVTGDFGEIKTKEELSGDVDSIEALVSLGYSANDAREALKQVDKTITNPSDKVREALKYLGK
ncbi:Holliday junction branch migration protein RuvA, partial [Candidatus Falkowbacteria bacterium]|nr:Holliday junction branch migration protein RuvA [Candidatus Falkowbacteria bacterium]